MNRQLQREDTEAWYRQFWPWFLIALPASVVIAGLTTLFIANRGADDLVVDEYYKDGLAINRQLEKKQKAEALGISAQLSFRGRQVRAELTGAVKARELRLLMSHPLEADRDFSIVLLESTPGEYLGQLTAAVAPRWHWTLELPVETGGWRLDGSVTAADLSNADEP